MPHSRQAIILQTHFYDQKILREYLKLSRAVRDIADPWMIYKYEVLPDLSRLKNWPIHLCSQTDLGTLDYPHLQSKPLPGQAHFPLIHFYRQHSKYEYYWLIEYDVRFTGNWHQFFQAYSSNQADFLSAHLSTYTKEPDWPHWNLHHPTRHIPQDQRRRSFNPIFRISRSALDQIDQAHQAGWQGHGEVLLATLLDQNQFTQQDLNQVQRSAGVQRNDRVYRSGFPHGNAAPGSETMRYRPNHDRSPYYPGMLYHPVKTDVRHPWKTSPSALFHRLITQLSYLF